MPSAADNVERELRESLEIPADFKFVYQKANGASLSAEQFVDLAAKGHHQYDVARDDVHKLVTLRMIDPSPTGRVGGVNRLPEFDLARLDGGLARSADLMGRVSVINFFFETCVPCIKEAPVLSAFRHKHPEFHYLAVTSDPRDAAQRFVEQRHLDWPVAIDAAPLVEALQIKAYPTYLLVAADGRILGRGFGMDTKAMDDPALALRKFEQWVKERLPK